MYLRRLEIHGFKSFAAKTELNFPHGVAAVVGPNGCGKSNVLDAIRWCLGEQSAKALRGGEMADVIFNGADSRPAVGLAEVTMTFTDCEEQLGTAYHEVSISRRGYRDGRGEYLLNRTLCRLRDIQELFMDTGIGRSAYSIMEQGKIDLILSSRPEDRRAIFEEAAGITKYKSQRKEAARKLEHTEINLTRLNDVIGEVKRQLGSLQRQAAKARRHQSLTRDLRLLDSHLAHELDSRLEHERTGARAELARLQAAHALAETELLAGETALRAARAAQEDVFARLQDARAAAQECRDRLRAAESKLEFNRERTTESQGSLGRYETELTGAEERLAAQVAQLHAAEEEERQIAGLLEVGQGELLAQDAAVRAARARRVEAESAFQAAARAAAEIERQLAVAQAELARLTQAQQAGEVHRELLGAEAARLDPARAEADERVAAAQAQITTAQSTLDTRRQELRAAEESQASAQKELAAAETAVAAAVQAHAARTSRLEVLRGLNDAGVGFSTGTQAVLRGLDQPELFKGAIIGVLGSSIAVEARFIPAVEAVLGLHLQTVLLRDDEVAATLLASLATGKKVGRATLATTADQLVERPRGELPPGALLWTVDAAQAPAAVAPLLSRLLVGSVVVATLETAHAVRRLHPHLTVVTLTGELLDRDGFLHGGRAGGESAPPGVLQRQAQIKVLAAETAADRTAIEKLTHSRAGTAARLQTAAAALTDARAALQASQLQTATLQSECALLERAARELSQRGDHLRREQEQVVRQCADAGEQVRALTQRLEETSGALDRHLNDRTAAQEKTATFHAQELALSETLNELRVRVATEQQRHEGLRRQLQPMDARRLEMAELIDRRRRELADHRQRLERYGAEAAELTLQIDAARAELAAAEAQIAGHRDKNAAAATAVEGIDADLRAKRQALTGWHDRKAREEVRETQLLLRQENLRAQILQRYQIDLPLFVPELAAFLDLYRRLSEQPDASADWAHVETLATGLREKLDALGTVNVDAIAEFDALEERSRFLETQNADLVAAKKDLLAIIGKINATTRALFAATFERVRVNFQEMYAELFGGGRANLLLANEEEPLECGIEIIARPPGKQLQSITLLSGGEKTMTAVALLFAIYMVKPSPFCVLDEMDAPLDDSNIARFLKILDRFVAQSQFIVITHNKRTIARADVLYGVTMEEAGVSKLVAVRLARHEQQTTIPPSIAESFGKSVERVL